MCDHRNKGSSDDDDVWDDVDDFGPGPSGRQDLQREANNRHQNLRNAGYLEGVEEGKERTLQQGFDIGFREGALAGYNWGMLRAAVKTLEIMSSRLGPAPGLHEQAALLAQSAQVPPRDAMLSIFKQILARPLPEAQHYLPRDDIAAALEGMAVQAGPGPSAPALGGLPDMTKLMSELRDRLTAMGLPLEEVASLPLHPAAAAVAAAVKSDNDMES